MVQRDYFLGLDIGTDSVGYAVTNEEYELLKIKGEPAWGVNLFDEAMLNDERRTFRSGRRRLDRRQQRVTFIQELFADQIAKVDKRFYTRQRESFLYREDTEDKFPLFCDPGYTDREYYRQYPTIHHLIVGLMTSDEPHDVRLVYLACAWLVAHRGHFLSNISKDNLSEIKDFRAVYNGFTAWFTDNGYDVPWVCTDVEALGDILKKKQGVTAKTKELVGLLFGGKKPPKEPTEALPYNIDSLVKLLAGGSCKLSDVFCNDEYHDLGSVSLGMDDDKMGEIMANIGDDFELIAVLRSIYDWTVLVDALGDCSTVSEAKVGVYNRHKADLRLLKRLVKKYVPEKYDEVFRTADEKLDNYVAYSYHTDDGDTSNVKKKNIELLSKYLRGIFKNVTPDAADAPAYADMMTRLDLNTFLPKQKSTDNRVIPHQLYEDELGKILNRAQTYLPFLAETDEDGLTVSEKIRSVFLFRIPYFVGPLNPHSKYAWLKRKAGKIYPWNFGQMVDPDASEQSFIQRMTNLCTYLPDEPVLPKDSLLYHRYSVINEINNIRINGERIPVMLKQQLYNEVFLRVKKVTHKRVMDFLVGSGAIGKGNDAAVTGIDININSNLIPQIAFRRLTESGVITEEDVERIIERASYAEDKSRLRKWLVHTYPQIVNEDVRYICSLKLAGFGRLSGRFLNGLEGICVATGEVFTIIDALWSTQNNLMELLSDKYTFGQAIEEYRSVYYTDNKLTLKDRLDEMYISNAVKRPIYRTLDIVRDVEKAFGAPKKIFIEMTRGGKPEDKGKRTKTRKQQILELYEKCKSEDVKLLREQLESMGDYADNRLHSDKLFLYYIQLGRSMYSNTHIDLEKLGTKEYDIDHIYPQAYVKDDSIINNKVLVLSAENGAKSDEYPLSDSIRSTMGSFWKFLNNAGLIGDEKYKRLIRGTHFTDEEKQGFINRQLTETSQSTKAVAALLKERYPDTEIVYCKARLTTEFRQEFELWKSRTYNDLHHAVDAYLNIVTGNVYSMKFTHNFRVDTKYSVKTKTLFTHPVISGRKTVWDGEKMLAKVKATAVKNTAHVTKYAFFKKGGFFDQNPVFAADGLVSLKKGLPTEKYGGYNGAGVMFFIPVKYVAGKKTELFIMSVELLYGDKFLANTDYARTYALDRLERILHKKIDSVSFPMGMRPWKVNTVLSLDGFRVCISGSASGGSRLITLSIVPFASDKYWIYYMKKLEMFYDKCIKSPTYIYNEGFDNVSKEKNLVLYDLYIDKLENSVYRKRFNSPLNALKTGREAFIALDVKRQAATLTNIQSVFGRLTSSCDLSDIGGAKHTAAPNSFPASVSNWAKYYHDVRIIDTSASGLWEKRSGNILELL